MKIEFRIRSKRLPWTRKFKTLEEALLCISEETFFKEDPTVFVEKIITEVVAVNPNLI